MMKIKKIGILIILFACEFCFAQEKNVDAIQAQTNFDAGNYFKALASYRKAMLTNKKSEKLALQSAICITKLNYPADSLYSLNSILAFSSIPDAKYFMGLIKHKQKKFDDAIEILEGYTFESKKESAFLEEASYLIRVCKNAQKFRITPHRSIINNMGIEINSKDADYMPVVSPDESALYLTSRRAGSSNNKKDVYGNFNEDVYVSRKLDGKWQKAELLGSPINTDANDACMAISPDGERLIIYRDAGELVTGDLYVTKTIKGNKWEALQKMSKEINSQFIETGACFSNDTSEIYFSSNRPGGYGSKDLYRIKKLPNGKWSIPLNLGSEINSQYDDEAPYLHPDGVTLYFSSKGHNTAGGYDIFKATLNPEDNNFSNVQNLGYPINDVGDDMFFVLSVDGQRAYYSSVKEDNFGGTDIYTIDTRFGDNDLKVKTGIAYLDNTPDKLKITLYDLETETLNGSYTSNPNTGRFILVLNPLKPYKAIVERNGYQSKEFYLEPIAKEPIEKNLEFKLEKLGK